MYVHIAGSMGLPPLARGAPGTGQQNRDDVGLPPLARGAHVVLAIPRNVSGPTPAGAGSTLHDLLV